MKNRTAWIIGALFIISAGLSVCQAQPIVNLAENGGFENGDMPPWSTYGDATGEVVTELVGAAIPEDVIEGSNCLHVVVPSVPTNTWDTGLQHNPHTFEKGKTYTVSAFFKSAKGTLDIYMKPERGADPWEGYGDSQITITEEWAEYTVTTPEFPDDVTPASLTWHIGFAEGNFWVDGMRFYEGEYVEPGFLNEVSASEPSPADGDQGVAREYAVLSWKPDPLAGTHDVYVGTTFEDVNNADAASPSDVLTSLGQDTASVTLPRLALGDTYYWRVDEVNATPDNTVFKGDVWSFQVEPYSVQLPFAAISATASTYANDNSTPDRTIDGSGLDAQGKHSNEIMDVMWMSATPDASPWLMYEFDQIYKLDKMLIWNSNHSSEAFVGWGIKDVQIEHSIDGVEWTPLAEPNQLTQGPGLSPSEAEAVDMGLALVKYVRLNILNNWGGVVVQYGVSEVQFHTLPVRPQNPVPASGTANVSPDTVLTWHGGREAGEHQVYFGSDASALALADSVTAPMVDLGPLNLDLGTSYFWQINEVNAAESWSGPVWSFSTPASIIVDNFESYTNFSPNRPFQTWLDGFGYSSDEFFPVAFNGNGTGAGAGHDIWALDSPHFDGLIMERDTVKGGKQSMPLYYDNTGAVASQTDRNWSTPQNWTGNGIQTLIVNFFGDPNNTGTSVFVEINGQKVTCPDNAALTTAEWTQWDIDLASLGTNLSAVTSMSIGVDGSGSGMILVDNIALYRVAPQVVEGVVFDFEIDAQGWGDLKDGTATTVSPLTHSTGGVQSLRTTIDEAVHAQQQGGWSSPQVFTSADAAGGLKSVSFWYRVDDPLFDGRDFIFHWIMSNTTGGGGWYGNGLYGVVIADGQWHQQTLDLSILGSAAGGWEGTHGDETAWAFRDDLVYNFELMVDPTDGTTGSYVYIDDVVFE